MATDCISTNNRSISANRSAFLNQSFTIKFCTSLGIFTTRIDYVRKNHRGSTKDIIFEGNTFIDRDIILNFHKIADYNVVADIDILPNRTAATDFRTGLNMTEVPDFGSRGDRDGGAHPAGPRPVSGASAAAPAVRTGLGRPDLTLRRLERLAQPLGHLHLRRPAQLLASPAHIQA